MSARGRGLRIAFVAGLSEKKLTQKIAPLAALECVERIDVYRREPFSLGDKVRWAPISALGRRSKLLGEAQRAISLLAGGGRYDVIIGCFQILHGVWAHLAGKMHGKPVIQLIITDVDWNRDRRLARVATLGASACGVRGPASLKKLRDMGYAGPAETIHNPFDPVFPEKTPGLEKVYDVAAVGNYAPEKDYPLMLEVLAALKKRRGRLKAVLCGRGFEALSRRIAALGLSDDLDFPGHVDEKGLRQAYGASRLLLMTSSVEGLPMVAVEAMSHGLPVVAPDVGELSWLVRDGVDGRILPGRRPEDYAGALAGLLDDVTLLEKAGESASGRIVELAGEFGTRAVSSRWLAMLRALGLCAGPGAV